LIFTTHKTDLTLFKLQAAEKGLHCRALLEQTAARLVNPSAREEREREGIKLASSTVSDAPSLFL
jgi:hypothetical protein